MENFYKKRLGRRSIGAAWLCALWIGSGMGVVSMAANHHLDFSGNGVDDLVVYNTSSGQWAIRTLAGPPSYYIPFGWSESSPVPGDYDGDGTPDLAVYNRASGDWYISKLNGDVIAWESNWGFSTAHAVGAGDYNGDGKSDLAVFDAKAAKWYIRSLFGPVLANGLQWGWGQAQSVPGDYNGDGNTDFAVYDRITGNWYIRTMSGQVLAWGLNWGWSETRPVAGDFNGDGKDDLAVYHRETGNWYIRTLDGQVLAWAANWGWNATRPVAGDFNGDGKTDMAVYHPSTGEWFIKTLQGGLLAYQTLWGGPESVPLSHYGNGAEGFVIVCFGDSITYGRGSSSNGPLTSYPTFLDRMIDTAIGGYSYVINAGVPGETTSRGRQRFNTVLTQHKPDLVLLMEGSNDLALPKKTSQVLNNLSWMAETARSRKISMVMSTMAPIADRWFANRYGQHQQIIHTNPYIRSLAASRGWACADPYARISAVPNWQHTLFNADQSIHPNDAGYRIMRDEFIRAIRSGMNNGQIVY